MTVTDLSKADAVAALRAVAFEVTEPEDSAYGRTLVRCARTFTGADWDLDDAIELVGKAERICWTRHMLSHDLQVWVGGEPYNFNVESPERAR